MNQKLYTKVEPALETNLDVAKLLVSSGLSLEDISARSVTWAQIGEVIGDELYVHGITIDRIPDKTIVDLAHQIAERLKETNENEWVTLAYQVIYDNPIADLLSENQMLGLFADPNNDDEGPMTEQYENATRSLDDEGYWPDGGSSAAWDLDF